MGKQSFTTAAKGWTWIFRNNKNPNLKKIDNPYNKDLERIATSFYVSNFPELLDAKGLWNACMTYEKLVDVFIANKCSKGGKRFGFIRFLGIKDANEFVRSILNIWIGNFHLYVAIALFQRDPSTVLLLKLNEADTLSNMYAICKSEGFMDLSIHHVGCLWIWIQFSSPVSCSKFCENANMKSLYSSVRTPSPSFKVDERMIWIEISGLC
ncbi:RNA-directed DNA polymerase, eukaryota, reverse transcriptase zinc-binding domain protein [Tanacetum coccineum]